VSKMLTLFRVNPFLSFKKELESGELSRFVNNFQKRHFFPLSFLPS